MKELNLIFYLVAFGACILGKICGMGGGVIIKPVLDAFGIMDVATISFLSGCTVLSMTSYSVIRSKLSGGSRIDMKVGIPLAAGAALGGVVGKNLFQIIRQASSNGCLLLVTLGTLLYTLYKSQIRTYKVTNTAVCGVIGLVLGMMSSFLGIGGGPINLVVLFFFFSMDTKTAAENSLYIILFSQIASVFVSIITHTVPSFSFGMLVLMAAGGICGGMAGRKLNRRLQASEVDKLFIGLMAVIILISFYNIWKFMS